LQLPLFGSCPGFGLVRISNYSAVTSCYTFVIAPQKLIFVAQHLVHCQLHYYIGTFNFIFV